MDSPIPAERLPKPLLNPFIAARKFQLTQHAPAEDLRPFIVNHWIVRWDLRGQPAYRQDILPYPCVNVAFEADRSVIAGVTRGRASRVIEGEGLAFGIKFKPGGFFPFFRQPISTLTDRLVPLATVFGPTALTAERRLLASPDAAVMVQIAEDFLRSLAPASDPHAIAVAEIVEAIGTDRAITAVNALEKRFGRSERTLQRLFSRYVGVSPKWVIRIYRLQEAADQMARGESVDSATLAAELNYHDQAHFIHDFKTVTGRTPAVYARDQRSEKILSKP